MPTGRVEPAPHLSLSTPSCPFGAGMSACDSGLWPSRGPFHTSPFVGCTAPKKLEISCVLSLLCADPCSHNPAQGASRTARRHTFLCPCHILPPGPFSCAFFGAPHTSSICRSVPCLARSLARSCAHQAYSGPGLQQCLRLCFVVRPCSAQCLPTCRRWTNRRTWAGMALQRSTIARRQASGPRTARNQVGVSRAMRPLERISWHFACPRAIRNQVSWPSAALNQVSHALPEHPRVY
jgi:hypothetical protein